MNDVEKCGKNIGVRVERDGVVKRLRLICVVDVENEWYYGVFER